MTDPDTSPNTPARKSPRPSQDFYDKASFIERNVAEMSRDERFVETGICYGYYAFGLVTLDEFHALREMLGLSREDWERACPPGRVGRLPQG